jgi:modification methylase
MTDQPTLSVWPVAQRSARRQRARRYLPASAAHPGKMLPELARRAIQTYSDRGDLVLDPMCGIGTTLVEATHEHRHAIGVELDSHWASVAAANVRHARDHGAPGHALMQPGDARALARGLLDAFAGRIDLILTSPPYGPSVHGHVRVQDDSVDSYDDQYSTDALNLANLPARRTTRRRPSFATALRDVLTGCARMLAPDGRLVLTARPYRRGGGLIDLPGQLTALAEQCGLAPRARHAALLCRLRDSGLVPRASFFQLRHQRSGAIPTMLLIAHEDVLVFGRESTNGDACVVRRPTSTALRSPAIHGLIDRPRTSGPTNNQSGPAALQRPGPGTEGSASMQANRSPQGSKKAAPKKAKARPTAARPSQREPREGSVMWAAIQVLQGHRKPMTAAEIYAEIAKRDLASGLKGKTPEQTVAATLAVAAKRGQHVERAERGKFQLLKKA